VRAEGKRVAFLCGSPTTNRLDVAVGRKISLLLRLPPANTRSLIARRARFPSRRSIRPPTFRRIARKSVRPRDQMTTHDRIRVLRILIIPSLALHSCCLFVRQLRGDSSCPPFRGSNEMRRAGNYFTRPVEKQSRGMSLRCTDLNARGSISAECDRDYARWKFRLVETPDAREMKSSREIRSTWCNIYYNYQLCSLRMTRLPLAANNRTRATLPKSSNLDSLSFFFSRIIPPDLHENETFIDGQN